MNDHTCLYHECTNSVSRIHLSTSSLGIEPVIEEPARQPSSHYQSPQAGRRPRWFRTCFQPYGGHRARHRQKRVRACSYIRHTTLRPRVPDVGQGTGRGRDCRYYGRDRFASSGRGISSAGSRIVAHETIDQTETGRRWLTMFTFLRLQLKYKNG